MARFTVAALAAITLALPVLAEAAPEPLTAATAKTFFNDKGCNACHGLDEQRIGPGYTVVAARYAGEYAQSPDEWVARMARKIRFGGGGAWGNVPMISNPGVSEAEAEAVARWIMTLSAPPAK